MPKIIAAVVIRIGRRRTCPACSSASCNAAPPRRARLAKSTSRIAFLVTSPISMTKPIIEKMLSVVPVSKQRQQHADQRERQRRHDRDRLGEARELRREDQVDEDDREPKRRQERCRTIPAVSSLLPGDGEPVARRKRGRLDDLLDVVADVARRAPLGVGVKRDARAADPAA